MDGPRSMTLKVAAYLTLVITQISVITSETDTQDVNALNSLKALWQNVPSSWNGFTDPCTHRWEGIACRGSRVITITLSSMGLRGTLSGDIQGLTELQTFVLSYNKGLSGPLPPQIGTLSKLSNLILIGCNFNGLVPDSIGSLSRLRFLSLNHNSFSGPIPNSIGNLSQLYWLDLADNKLTGTIPVSNATAPGLDMLVNTKHFHFGMNQLSGPIPPQLFHENMTLIHVLFDNNKLTGSIPETIGLVTTMEVLRLDWNSLSEFVPSSISNLTNITDLLISNNGLAGPLPVLSGMDYLSYLDMSNNTFDPTDIPAWFTGLPSLTTLMMEETQMEGAIPTSLFSLPQLQTVVLKKNKLSGELDLDAGRSSELKLVDLQSNNISAYVQTAHDNRIQLVLVDNPICEDFNRGESYCTLPQQSEVPYSTPQNCVPVVCVPTKVNSPNCRCAYPYTGTLVFRATKFSDLRNFSYYSALEQKLLKIFSSSQVPVDSVSLSNVSKDSTNYLKMSLQIFPVSLDRFNRTAIFSIGFILSNQTFKPPPSFGPFYFMADEYTTFADEPDMVPKKTFSLGPVIGISVAVCVILLIILLFVGACLIYNKKSKRPVESAEPANPSGFASSASWISPGRHISSLKLSGSRPFSFEEINKITNDFSEANMIGSGAYGKVYRGTLAYGELVAIKRSGKGSKQGGPEFRTEIELLSRVHHKNLVRLLGFCLEKEELILVYEYVPNGTLNESLSGKSGIRLDWRRRIQVALGAARGLAYLHELANPTIIHRDIKSNNILLDENLNAKVSDFGLSRPLYDLGMGHIITEVKGTMGYLDPEYYMTQKLNEKSDVYSFGVLLLELISGRPPIDNGKYIVRQVRNIIDRTQDLYGLQELLDESIGLGTTLKGFAKYVDLALRCLEDSGADRPPMGEVVKQLEDILEMAGLNPYSDSATSSATFDGKNIRNPYEDDSLYTHTAALPR